MALITKSLYNIKKEWKLTGKSSELMSSQDFDVVIFVLNLAVHFFFVFTLDFVIPILTKILLEHV